MKRVPALLITLALIAGMLGCPADSVLDPEPDPAPPAQYTLTVGSTISGLVFGPGEGTFTYDEGAVVNLKAFVGGGYLFVDWTGDVDTVADVTSAHTTITILGDYSVTANWLHRSQLAMDIHQQAIDMVLDRAENDNFHKYAIYTSRSLMVKHPEIYLQADALFLERVQTNPGFQRSYEIDTVEHPYLLGEALTGPPFSFDLVDFTRYTIIPSSGIYPGGYPVLPYVDRRLLTMTATLKSVGNGVTQLAKIQQYYFALKEDDAAPEQMYIIYCDNEDAYLYRGGDVISAGDLDQIAQIEGNPILVFNEQNVWYPLMGRDDTENDAILRSVVDRYTTGITEPELTGYEATVVSRFATITALTADEMNMAMIAAARDWDRWRSHGDNRPFQRIWENAGIQGTILLGNMNARIAIVHMLINNANYLSPITAYLAAAFEEYEGEAKIQKLCRLYLAHASAPVYGGRQAHGHIWVCGIMEFNIEDSYYTHAGCCTTQAANIKAVLDLAGIESYWIHAGDHSHVYIPEYNLHVDNGSVTEQFRTSVFRGPLVTYLAHKDKWANFNPIEEFGGTLSPEGAIAIFDYLSSTHGYQITGFTYGRVAICSEAFLDGLSNHEKTWRAVKLPSAAEVLFPAGSGTEDDPYQIADWHHLHNVRYNQYAHFILTNDIDATTAGYAEVAGATANGGRGWKPIGTGHHPFTGVFDGRGYEIGDVLINRPDEEGVGFFHEVGQHGVIKNIGLASTNVIGLGRVGGLVAWNHGAVINSYVNVNVTGEIYGLIGGLVAINEGTVIDSCSAGSVIGASPIGGLVGQNYHGTVSGSYAIGSVTSDGVCVGGLVGDNVGGTVSNSYATGSVTGHAHVGGLVGQNCFGAAVSNSYSTGRVTGEGYSNVGGLVGANASDATVSSSFWNIETSGVTESGGGTGKTTAQMKSITTFKGAGWHISGVGSGETNTTYTWSIVDGETYPFLSWQPVS